MADNVLKTRIKLLYKTWAEWQAIQDTFYPLKGEMCIVEVPDSTGVFTTEPTILFKVGCWDGDEGSASKLSFGELGWASALAADVYAWAKKEHLSFTDLDDTFLAKLDERIAEKSVNDEYQMVGSNGVWKLQKRAIGSSEWSDVSTVDVAAYVTPLIQAEQDRAEDAEGTLQSNIDAEEARAIAAEAKKVNITEENANGKSQFINESDGGGVFFIKNDGTRKSFVGVNDSTAGGPDAQIYAIDPSNSNYGAKLDITKDGIYYTVGSQPYASRVVDDNLLVVKKDIEDLAGGMHFIGVVTQASGETIEAAIERVYTEAGKSYADRKAGDLVIIKTTDSDREFVCDSSKNWVELGDQGVYATKAQLAAEETARQTADATLQTNINGEASARQAADTTLQTNIEAEVTRATTKEEALEARIEELEEMKYPEVQHIGNYDYLFANGVSIRIEDNTTENIAYYCTAEGIQKSISFPYNSIVHGGGIGTLAKRANYNSSLVIMNSGKVKSIYGGSRDFGNVSVATIVVNGGTLQEGPIGGGAAANAETVNNVGLANITLNGGSSLMTYGGGMGLATVGKVNILVNGGTHQWVTAGGANGTTGSADVKITGGIITCFQAVNRGTIQDATVTITGGTIANVYGGGETGDSGVTGKCEKTIFHIEKAFGGHLNKGTYGGVEDASRVSGDYIATTITAAEAAACNLVEKRYAGLANIAYTGSTDDLVAGTEVWILDCNL